MTGKHLGKKSLKMALNILILNKNKYVQVMSKINLNCEKKNSIKDSKQRKRRLTLSCSKKTVCTTRRNNFKTLGLFLLFELSSFLLNIKKKKNQSHEKLCENKDFC